VIAGDWQELVEGSERAELVAGCPAHMLTEQVSALRALLGSCHREGSLGPRTDGPLPRPVMAIGPVTTRINRRPQDSTNRPVFVELGSYNSES
jgi:hypothetical protein